MAKKYDKNKKEYHKKRYQPDIKFEGQHKKGDHVEPDTFKFEGQPKNDKKMDSIDDAIKRQQERVKEKEATEINMNIFDGIKKGIEQTSFTAWGGIWKTMITVYNSCTDEFGRITTSIDELGDKIYSAQKSYFHKRYGKWLAGDQEISETLGEMVYREYLGDIKQILKPFEEEQKNKLAPKLMVEKVLNPLADHFNEKITGLFNNKIISLDKNNKEKLKDELVYRAHKLGRSLTKAELLSDKSLVKAIYRVIGEEEGMEYKNSREGKPLLEELS